MSASTVESALVYDPTMCRVCFTCELICSITNAGEFNPTKSSIRISARDSGKVKEMNLSEDCIECGVCVQYCPYDALEMR